MKKLAFTGLAALLMLAGLNSCNDSDPEFGIYSATNYITVADENYTFFTMMSTWNYELKSASVLVNSMPITNTKIDKYGTSAYFQAYETGYSLSSFNGTYNYQATSVEDYTDSFSFTMNLSSADEPSSVEYEEFSFDGNYLTLKLTEKNEDTDGYGFYLDYDLSSPFPSTKDYLGMLVERISNNTVKISLEDIKSLPEDYNVRVYPVAIKFKSGVTTVVKFSGSGYKTLKKGAQSFEEDAQ